MAHMVWGKGGLLNAALGGRFPTLDFAGGTVVHITSGVSALVCALYLGKRTRLSEAADARRIVVVLSFIGACLLWVGWFGFNAGSALACQRPGDQRLRRDPFRRRRSGHRLARRRVGQQRQAQRARSHLRRRRRSGRDYSGGRIRGADACAPDRPRRRRRLLLHGHVRQGPLRIRRCTRRVWRSRRRRHDWSAV